MTERTLVLIKPDAVARGYVGEILSRIERKGLTIAALDLRVASEEVAGSHYAEHAERPFYPSLLEFITSGPLVVVEPFSALQAVASSAAEARNRTEIRMGVICSG